MGWSLPEVPEKEQASAWSPWVCVSIIVLGLFSGLTAAVMTLSTAGLTLSGSGHWLPLAIWTFTGILAAIAIYSFWWEIRAVRVWNWNTWCRNMHMQWRRHANQHLTTISHVFIPADTDFLPRLAHTQEEEGSDTKRLTLLSDTPLTPGISRFEQLLHHLISQITPSLMRRYPSGPLQIIIQTSGPDKEREAQSFQRIWATLVLPWKADLYFQAGSSFDGWNQFVESTKLPVLVLAMHFRQPEDILPEFASALFLMPSSMLNSDEQKNGLRLFRAMPLNTGVLVAELSELREMAQLPKTKEHLVWHSGLRDAARKSINRVLIDLSLPLYDGIGTGGIIDFDSACDRYGGLAGWAMVSAAADMVAYGPTCQWLLLEDKNEAWAVAIGNAATVVRHDQCVVPSPFPGGSILLALLLNAGLYSLMIEYFPSTTFSWVGIILLLLSLVVTLPGIAFVLRRVTARFQRPLFIKAARQSGKE